MLNLCRRGLRPRLCSPHSVQKNDSLEWLADSLILTGASGATSKPWKSPHHSSFEMWGSSPLPSPVPAPSLELAATCCNAPINIRHPTSETSFDFGWDDTLRKQLQIKFHTYLWMWRLQINTRCNLFILFKMRLFPYEVVLHIRFPLWNC